MSGEQLWYNRPLPGARVNMAHPLSLGLVGCWLLNEQMGLRAMDLSPYGNHGLLVGFPTGGQRAFNGLRFDGVDDYINVGRPISIFPGEITMEAWINHIDDTNEEEIVSNWGAGNPYLLGLAASDNRLFFKFTTAGGQNSVADSVPIQNQVWTHVAATWSSTRGGTLYKDTVALGSDNTFSGALNSNTLDTEIGRLSGDNSFAFGGLIGLVRVYNRALNADEIKALSISPYSPMGLRMFF